MRRALLALLFVLLAPKPSLGQVAYCQITGMMLYPAGSPCGFCQLTIRTVESQNIGGMSFPLQTEGDVYFTDASGLLPNNVYAARTLVVGITVASDTEKRVRIPDQPLVTCQHSCRPHRTRRPRGTCSSGPWPASRCVHALPQV
jgi:hypothetical protein